ncbi:MAG: hypothetical protein M1839_009314 [Geoglossum umbratile]|nr:MAG: hypothetical protein M1839_009314 [Geoglossum umbratile]
MASQGNDQSQSQTKRPSIGTSNSEQRQNGFAHAQSTLATSPPGTQRPHHKAHMRQHVVSHVRMGARVPSYGKNLNKHSRDTAAAGKHHRRSHSHTPSTSPRGGQYKRTGSNLSLTRNGSKTHTNGSTTDVGRRAGAAATPPAPSMQRSLSQPVRSERITKTAVKFDLGSEGQGASWTEASTSESPNNIRSTLSAQGHGRQDRGIVASREPRSPIAGVPEALPSASSMSRPRDVTAVSDHTASHWTTKQGQRKHMSTSPPQAEIITSRLLQRHPPQNAPPQMSTLSATATPGNRSPSPSSHEQRFTNGTPSTQENVVSRFIGGSSDTHGLSFVSPGKSILDVSDIGAEAGTKAKAESSSSLPSQRAMEPKPSSGRSNRSTLSSYNYPPSRTQQKLWLQRASSGIEPQQLAPSAGVGGMPSVRASAGGIGTLGAGYSDSRDLRLQREFERTGLEYLVVRRYKNPVGDSIARLVELPGAQKNRRIPPQFSRGYANGGDGPMGLSQSLRERGGREPAESGGTRASLDGTRGSKDDSGVNRPVSQGLERHSDEIDQVLRRMWDRVEMVGGE